MVRWVRSGVMAGAPELVAELGGSFGELAKAAGVPLRPLANPDLPVRVDRFVVFLEMAAGRLNEPGFGLMLGQRQNLALFGPMAQLFGNAATVGEMVRDLADFFPLHTQGAIVGLERSEDGMLMTYELAAEVGNQQRQVIELGFGVMLRELRRHYRDWVPLAVTLRHAPPPQRAMHRRLMGENVIFNADRNALLLDNELLSCRIARADPSLHGQLVRQYGAAAREAEGMLALRTEALVRAMLPFAPVNLAVAARLLRHSRRALQRRLAAQGASFEGLVTRVRAGLAMTYLRESTLTVGEIAEILRFSETSALSRFVRQQFGQSPRLIRGSNRRGTVGT